MLLLQILNDFSNSDQDRFLWPEGSLPKETILNSSLEIVRQFVEENYREKITFKTIAGLASVGTCAFLRFFCQTFKNGSSPSSG